MSFPTDPTERGLEKLDPDSSAGLLALVNPHFAPLPMGVDSTYARRRPLSFYPGYDLLAFTDRATIPPITKFAIKGGPDIRVIDWTNEPVFDLNAKVPIRLDARTAEDYLRFFFAFVAGRHGRFLLLESIDDIPFFEEPPPQALDALKGLVRPLAKEAEGKESGGKAGFVFRATFLFQDSLFSARVTIASDGAVAIDDEKQLLEGMPATSDFGLR